MSAGEGTYALLKRVIKTNPEKDIYWLAQRFPGLHVMEIKKVRDAVLEVKHDP